MKTLRKRRISSVQKWGKGSSEPKQARPDVLGFEDDSDDDDDEDDTVSADADNEITAQTESHCRASYIPSFSRRAMSCLQRKGRPIKQGSKKRRMWRLKLRS